jgi:flagellar basal-body rod modification protein FlgD
MLTQINQISQITPSTSLASAATAKGNQTLGQKDFLTLLTAQLRNQDPLKPLENTEFLGQMAQFSTVAGIDRLNETLAGQGGNLRDARMAMATGMLGHSVLVQTPLARPDAQGAVRGAVDLPGPAQAVIVTYSDARTGALLHSQTMGAQAGGRVPFEWADLPPEMVTQRSQLRISVTAATDTGSQSLEPLIFARVQSASAAAGTDDVMLQVEDYGALSTLEIEAFR